MFLFKKEPEKPNYGKIIAITAGIIVGIGAIAFLVYALCKKYSYNCDCDDDLLDDCDCFDDCEDCEDCLTDEVFDAAEDDTCEKAPADAE